MTKASKKHHSSSSKSSKRKHRESKSRSTTNRSSTSGHRPRERSRHSNSDSLSTFAIQDHPSGVSLPYPEFDFPPPPVPRVPLDTPRAPQPVIVRQHGLYMTPRQNEPEGISYQKPWTGPPTQKSVVVNSDPEKGMYTNYINTDESKESTQPSKPQSRWRTRKCIFILLLVVTLFLVLPVGIGVGIVAKKRHDSKNTGSENEEVFSSGELDNGLSFGDWYCAQCRCYSDEESLNKCLEHLNSGSMDAKER